MVEIALGGKTDPRFGGEPLHLTARLTGLYDGWFTGDGPMIGGQRYCHGPTATVDAHGIEILVVTHPGQMLDQQQFRALGIQPDRKRVIALKSQQHFRAAFTPIAGKIVIADAGGLSTSDLSRFPFTRVRRPIDPLDADMSFEPEMDAEISQVAMPRLPRPEAQVRLPRGKGWYDERHFREPGSAGRRRRVAGPAS